MLDHSREGRTDRAAPAGVGHELGDYVRDRVGRRRAWREDSLPVRHQVSGAHVDDGALDPGPADVDAEGFAPHRPSLMARP